MNEEKYKRARKANGDKPVFGDDRNPLDHVWSRFDRDLALAPTNVDEDQVLKEYRQALMRAIVDRQPK